ncbi:MAG TPA: hypothetical protein VD772_04625, partial [Anseongella sp.]|nr:hypothetical protein [Anseongella sp.]
MNAFFKNLHSSFYRPAIILPGLVIIACLLVWWGGFYLGKHQARQSHALTVTPAAIPVSTLKPVPGPKPRLLPVTLPDTTAVKPAHAAGTGAARKDSPAGASGRAYGLDISKYQANLLQATKTFDSLHF